ncbi:MAG TPA: tetratricopeptide repeat protein [Terriglobales bacterium]|nr:tetratricopeptide repeat protein [Terriglobales bacterium]
MKPLLPRATAILLITLISTPQLWATCGGGGGGGMGGMSAPGMGSGQGMPAQETYNVPWRLRRPDVPPVTAGLVLYWFPSSVEEVQRSSLRTSRILSLYASQCVSMEIADADSPLGQKLIGAAAKLPVAVLATPDGAEVAKIENKDGYLRADPVEKVVDQEFKRRENSVSQQIKQAKERAKSGDTAGAIPLYRAVLEQKCLFPGKAKDAAKALKKLGVNDVGDILNAPDFSSPVYDAAKSTKIERTMLRGLTAENAARYKKAEELYSRAHSMDPADPTPLRYLGELYRHHIGDWDKARQTFDQILAMPADPLARAVALHGLGKMTIHEGQFKEGLALMERSVETFPIALAYRNLAVYWNSEGNAAKTDYYVHKALELEPNDAYNLVFAAGFMVANGHGDEALKIAREHEAMLPASYNLAAIYAQLGQRDKALALLKRHFFSYERYQAVRAKEMMEARVDAVFASQMKDPEFIALTSGADGRLPLRHGQGMSPGVSASR